MSEQNTPETRTEEPELNDEALEQVAGGCEWGNSISNDPMTIIVPTLPTKG